MAEVIPVGQSIDSSEYRAFDGSAQQAGECSLNQENTAPSISNNTLNENNTDHKQDIEEAAIKIQALFRGHLTRKALKDAQLQGLSNPNAIGRCHFDEDSLTRNRK